MIVVACDVLHVTESQNVSVISQRLQRDGDISRKTFPQMDTQERSENPHDGLVSPHENCIAPVVQQTTLTSFVYSCRFRCCGQNNSALQTETW